MKKTLFPTGVDNFAKLVGYPSKPRNPYFFIDKTMFIDAFLGSGDTITLITRPRRFGKTLNLSMLEHFFSAEVKGVPTKSLFEGLKISAHKDAMAYQGKYPTIFLTLKDVKANTYAGFLADMKSVVQNLYSKHRYLLKNGKVHEDQRNKFQKFIDGKAKEVGYKNALYFLSNLLYTTTGQEVVILLDEYDTPIHNAYVHGYYDECALFLSGLFGKTFKGNDYLYKGLLTGILKVTKASLFSELNNVKVYSTLRDKRYGAYFGFTEAETNQFLDEAGLPKKAHDLKEMYNGYQIGNYTLYNPFSIVMFASEAILDKDHINEAMQPYWVNSGGTRLLIELLRTNLIGVAQDLRELIQGGTITSLIDEELHFTPHLIHNPAGFWSIMLLSGYLKIVARDEQQPGMFQEYTLAFPNEEIRQTFKRLAVTAGTPDSHNLYALELQRVCHELVQGNAGPLGTYLERSLKVAASMHDVKGPYKEQFFHGLLLGITSCLTPTHRARSNRESGDGRYDISLIPKDTTQLGVILEIKVAGKKDDLHKTAQQALAQIVDLNYASQMEALGVKQIMKIGIAFQGKEVAWTHSRD